MKLLEALKSCHAMDFLSGNKMLAPSAKLKRGSGYLIASATRRDTGVVDYNQVTVLDDWGPTFPISKEEFESEEWQPR